METVPNVDENRELSTRNMETFDDIQTDSRIEIISNDKENRKFPIRNTETFDDIQIDSPMETMPNDDESQKKSNRRSPTNRVTDDSMDSYDFVTNLDKKHRFSINTKDLAKLFAIRQKKIQKKKNRLFEKMGLPIVNDTVNHPKQIFLSQSMNRSNNNINHVIHSKSNTYRMK